MLILLVITDANPEITQFLINHSNAINAQGMHGMTALHFAAIENDVNVIKPLLIGDRRRVSADLNLRDHAGNRPLISALMQNSVKAACRLIDEGADINMANHSGETPLMLAIA